MTTRRNTEDFDHTAAGMYLRQAAAALIGLIEEPEWRAPPAIERVQLGACTLYRVSSETWRHPQRRRQAVAGY